MEGTAASGYCCFNSREGAGSICADGGLLQSLLMTVSHPTPHTDVAVSQRHTTQNQTSTAACKATRTAPPRVGWNPAPLPLQLSVGAVPVHRQQSMPPAPVGSPPDHTTNLITPHISHTQLPQGCRLMLGGCLPPLPACQHVHMHTGTRGLVVGSSPGSSDCAVMSTSVPASQPNGGGMLSFTAQHKHTPAHT